MTKPEIIGSVRSSYTRIVRMVCEEKGIDYDLTEDAAWRGWKSARCIRSARCRYFGMAIGAVRVQGDRDLSRPRL